MYPREIAVVVQWAGSKMRPLTARRLDTVADLRLKVIFLS